MGPSPSGRPASPHRGSLGPSRCRVGAPGGPPHLSPRRDSSAPKGQPRRNTPRLCRSNGGGLILLPRRDIAAPLPKQRGRLDSSAPKGQPRRDIAAPLPKLRGGGLPHLRGPLGPCVGSLLPAAPEGAAGLPHLRGPFGPCVGRILGGGPGLRPRPAAGSVPRGGPPHLSPRRDSSAPKGQPRRDIAAPLPKQRGRLDSSAPKGQPRRDIAAPLPKLRGGRLASPQRASWALCGQSSSRRPRGSGRPASPQRAFRALCGQNPWRRARPEAPGLPPAGAHARQQSWVLGRAPFSDSLGMSATAPRGVASMPRGEAVLQAGFGAPVGCVPMTVWRLTSRAVRPRAGFFSSGAASWSWQASRAVLRSRAAASRA
jgi:hypothetical protein